MQKRKKGREVASSCFKHVTLNNSFKMSVEMGKYSMLYLHYLTIHTSVTSAIFLKAVTFS